MAVNFTSVAVKEKTYAVADFCAIKKRCVNLRAEKDGLYPEFLLGDKIENNTGVNAPLRFYPAGNDKYVYNYDGKVRVFGTGAALENATFISAPELKYVLVGGEKRYYLIGEDKSYSFTDGSASAFSGSFFTFFGGAVYLVKNGELKFSLPFDFLDGNGDLKATESYFPEKDIGKAIALSHDYDKLYILCEKGIITADFNDAPEKYSFKGVKYDDLSVSAESVAVGGDKIYFFSGEDFCVAEGGKIRKLSTPLKSRDFRLTDKPFCYNGTYYSETRSDDIEYDGDYLAVDLTSGEHRFLSMGDSFFCGRECGVIYRATGNAFYTHAEDSGVLIGKRRFESLPLSFGGSGIKKIVGFSVCSEGGPTVTITGDNGEFTFELKGGPERKRANITGREFSIAIESDGKFALKDLKIKYTEN